MATAVRLKLPITFVILKNRRYAALSEFAPVFGYKAHDPVAGTTWSVVSNTTDGAWPIVKRLMDNQTTTLLEEMSASEQGIGGVKEVDAHGDNVGDVLRSLAEQHPATQTQIFADGGELNRYVNVYLNDEDVRFLDGVSTKLTDGDSVTILPAVAGGMA